MFRRTALIAAAGLAALLVGSASAGAQAPTCKTPVAKDGHEPPLQPVPGF